MSQQSFRSFLWAKISDCFYSTSEITSNFRLDTISRFEGRWLTFKNGATLSILDLHINKMLSIYLELKPLYDIVDGKEGICKIPTDILSEWWKHARPKRKVITDGTLCRYGGAQERYPQLRGPTCSWYADGTDPLEIILKNFAIVLDKVVINRLKSDGIIIELSSKLIESQTQATENTNERKESAELIKPPQINEHDYIVERFQHLEID